MGDLGSDQKAETSERRTPSLVRSEAATSVLGPRANRENPCKVVLRVALTLDTDQHISSTLHENTA